MSLTPKPFYLLRHGQSFSNKEGLTCGKTDSPLTSKGISQACKVAKIIGDLPFNFSTIYHSSLIRAKDTAQIINLLCHATLVEDMSLNEHDFGDWENKAWEPVLNKLENGQEPPNGETNSEFFSRIKNAINNILSTPSKQPPLIVSHGGVSYALSCLLSQAIKDAENCALLFFEPPTNNQLKWKISKTGSAAKTGTFLHENT